jgi:TolB protein
MPQTVTMQFGLVPRVSPDGRRVAFLSKRDGELELYLVDADGSNLRRITNTPEPESELAWSRDGSQIVVRRGTSDDGDRSIVLIDPASGKERVLLTEKKIGSPELSPDGRRLLFTKLEFPMPSVWVMDLDGKNRRQIVHGMGGSWSPDGTRILYTRPVLGLPPKLALFVANADGSSARQLESVAGAEYPAWSPDGRRIAYFAKVKGDSSARIRLIRADGQGDTAITLHATKYHDETPSWFPDGKRLAIQSNRDGRYRVYVIDLQGNMLANLTP